MVRLIFKYKQKYNNKRQHKKFVKNKQKYDNKTTKKILTNTNNDNETTMFTFIKISKRRSHEEVAIV